MDNKKTAEKNFIKTAVEDFLSKGGTIKKIDRQSNTADKKASLPSDDFIGLTDVHTPESVTVLQLKKRFGIDETG
jgi:hypothetical protein